MSNFCKHVDMVTLGERGQIVIPASIREELGLKSGDKLMVFMKHHQVIGVIPADRFASFIEHLQDLLENQPEEDATTT